MGTKILVSMNAANIIQAVPTLWTEFNSIQFNSKHFICPQGAICEATYSNENIMHCNILR